MAIAEGLHRFEILVRDSKVGELQRKLVGLAVKVDGKPVVNAQVGADGSISAVNGGTNICSMFEDMLRTSGVTEITPGAISEWCISIGKPAGSRAYAIKCGLDAGYLKKKGKGKFTSYLVVKPAPATKTKQARRKK